jgi:(5-formylfuran-3-yl)methyl phosphate synthase
MNAAASHTSTTGPELLISVRNSCEFDLVRACNVSIIDFKEPSRGPLAPTDLAILRSAAIEVAGQNPTCSPLSAALGERSDAVQLAAQIPPAFAFAKVGPSGCRDKNSLRWLWQDVRERLAPSIELVAVAYADADLADCLQATEVIQTAGQAGFRRCLIDTFGKNGQSTLNHLSVLQLDAIQQQTRKYGMWWALAGSIRMAHVHKLWLHDVQPNCFGVRGDVCCDGRREDALSVDRVQAWQMMLSSKSGRPIETGHID